VKKILKLGLFAILIFSFAGCDVSSSEEGTTTDSSEEVTTAASSGELSTTANNEQSSVALVKSVLEGEGYTFTERDQDSIDYYTENMILNLYGVTATVNELYLGYVNSTERWLELIGFSSSTEAQAYYDAVVEQDESGMLIFIENDTVVITFSQDTIDALNE